MVIWENGTIRAVRYAVARDMGGNQHYLEFADTMEEARATAEAVKVWEYADALYDANNTEHEKLGVEVNGRLVLEGFGALDPERNEPVLGVQLTYNERATYEVTLPEGGEYGEMNEVNVFFVGSRLSRCVVERVELGYGVLFEGEQEIYNDAPDGSALRLPYGGTPQGLTLRVTLTVKLDMPDFDLPQVVAVEVPEDGTEWANGLTAVDEAEMRRILAEGAPTLEQVKAQKVADIKRWAHDAIVAGVDCDIKGRGTLHYSLDQQKQDDLKVLVAAVQAGKPAGLWRDDSRAMHEVYTAAEIVALYGAAMVHIVGCKLRSDGLEEYLSEMNDAAAVRAVTWDTQLPPDIEATLQELAGVMLS